MSKNKIVWESWNVKEQDLVDLKNIQHKNLLTEFTGRDGLNDSDEFIDDYSNGHSIEVAMPHVDTPFGLFNTSSIFKPSDRWDCWIAHTNFPVGPKCLRILNEYIPGIEALSIMGAYTFCIGIAKLFDTAEVKQSIESVFCGDIDAQRSRVRKSLE